MTEVRDKINDRLTISRLTLETRRAARPFVIICLFAAMAVAITIYFVSNISKTALSSSQTAAFAVSDATGVVAGEDQVRYKGIPVGSITAVNLHDGVPVLTVEIQSRYGRIYRDAEAVLRPNTPLMDMYLDIVDRGTSSAGAASVASPVPESHTAVSVNVDDVLDTFRANVRTSLETTLAQLGRGLADRGVALRESFAELVPLLQVAGRISDQLAARGPLVKDLVHNIAVLTSTLGQRQRMLRTLVSEGSRTVGVLAASRADLGATLTALPPTLRALDSSFASLRSVLPPVDGALNRLYPVAADLPSALRSIRRLTQASTPAVRALQLPVQRLDPLATALVPLSTNLRTAITRLLPQTPAVDKVTRDLAECGPGIQGFFQYDMSTWKLNDFRTTLPRGNFAASLRSSALVNDPNTARAESCVDNTEIGPGPPTAQDLH